MKVYLPLMIPINPFFSFQLELWVDEEHFGSVPLAGTAFPARNAGLFLGGVRELMHASIPLTAFKGTLADLIVDAQ